MADEKRIIIKRATPIARSPFVAVEVLPEVMIDLAAGTASALVRDIDQDGNSGAAASARTVALPPEVVDGLVAAFVAAGQGVPEKDGGLPAGDVVAAVAELTEPAPVEPMPVEVVAVKG